MKRRQNLNPMLLLELHIMYIFIWSLGGIAIGVFFIFFLPPFFAEHRQFSHLPIVLSPSHCGGKHIIGVVAFTHGGSWMAVGGEGRAGLYA